jgi:hypothetical protein
VIFVTPTLAPTATATATASATPTASATRTPTASFTPTTTFTPSATATPTITYTPTFDLQSVENRATVNTATTLHAGPGGTYAPLKTLNLDDTVLIVERNRLGNWVRVWQFDEFGRVIHDGWLLTGTLAVSPKLQFSRLPISALPDADQAAVRGQRTERLYTTPIIPQVDPAMLAVYRRGQILGNQPRRITKVGDSVSANTLYLKPVNSPEHELGPYDFLADTIGFFKGSLQYDSIAAQKGLSTFAVLDAAWADSLCEPNEIPLTCEYRLRRPIAAFIMFGPNDQFHFVVADYEAQMRSIIEQSLSRGVIPILSTYSSDPKRWTWEISIEFNLTLIELADEYNIPLMNLWLATRDLPDYGLEGDGIHMKNYGFDYFKYDSGYEARFGVSMQNLVALVTLDELRQALAMR